MKAKNCLVALATALPPTKPDAPTEVNTGYMDVDIKWTAPNVTGKAITNYLIIYQQQDKEDTRKETTSESATVTRKKYVSKIFKILGAQKNNQNFWIKN